MPQENFSETIRAALTSFVLDIKTLSRLADDPDLDDASREAAAAAAILVLSGTQIIPGLRGVQGYIDDALVMRLTIEKIANSSEEAREALKAHTEEDGLLADYAKQLEATRAFLGDSFALVEKGMDTLSQLKIDGYNAKDCVDDPDASNWLYDSIVAASVKLDFPPSEIARASKAADAVLTQLRARLPAK